MSVQNNNQKAVIYGLISVFFWSTVATAFSISLKHLEPAQLLLIASITSFIFLLTLVLIKKQAHLLIHEAKKSYKSSLFFGAINPFIYYLILLAAYDLLPAQEAQAINYTWAIMLSLLAVPLMKQRLTSNDIVAALCCYFGVLVIATQGHPLSLNFGNLTGVLLALLSTIIWALYWLFNTKDTRPSLIGLTLNFAFAIPMIFIYCWANGNLTNWPIEGVLGAFYIGLFEMGITFVLWNQALKLTDKASRIANFIFLSPILSIFWLSQFAGETIQSSTIIGLVCILLGLSVQNLRRAKSQT
ncbi:membrane protein [Marinomonas sp. S3726]|uniref:DMT family transporter n=1 Tax=Marinomonas sp. S3726 TaxID=579484 RepID=UPI0005F9F64B|nr:DMT family transporter [Marinomonas sp. S3726]KJZ16303.1 membrane protein [Marinomonas sp. S3726]